MLGGVGRTVRAGGPYPILDLVDQQAVVLVLNDVVLVLVIDHSLVRRPGLRDTIEFIAIRVNIATIRCSSAFIGASS